LSIIVNTDEIVYDYILYIHVIRINKTNFYWNAVIRTILPVMNFKSPSNIKLIYILKQYNRKVVYVIVLLTNQLTPNKRINIAQFIFILHTYISFKF
jgi:hypothetical protein